jgi:translation initiation factor 2 alpha subunit (eIF-2alpha)
LRFKARLVFGTFMMRGVREVCENVAAREWPAFLAFLEWEEIEGGKVKSVRLLKKSGGRY